MAYKQSPLAYSRTSNMPGLEYSEEDLAQKERIASNALGITPPADLLDGEFFLKDNDPQDFYRTLYIKRGESLDKIVTFTNTGKAIFDGVNEINLSDDEEVKGVLPKQKIITAATTAPVNNVTEIIAYDGNKFQAVNKNDLTNKIKDDINAEIDIDNYYNKTESDDRYFNKDTDVLSIERGGTGKKTAAEAYAALGGGELGKLDSLALTDAKLKGILPISKGGTQANTAQGAANNILKSVSTASMLSSSSYAFILESNVVKKILASKLGGNVEVLETAYATWEVGLATITGTLKGELTSVYLQQTMHQPLIQECNPSYIQFPMEVIGAYKVSGNLPNNRFTMQVQANGRILFHYNGTTKGEKCSLAGIVVKAQRV